MLAASLGHHPASEPGPNYAPALRGRRPDSDRPLATSACAAGRRALPPVLRTVLKFPGVGAEYVVAFPRNLALDYHSTSASLRVTQAFM
jgi:hypothetical protein